MSWTRRAVLTALTAVQTPPPPETRLFVGGPLADNGLARRFRVPASAISLPDVRLLGKDGRVGLRSLRGKVRLVSLWAEWCAPCLLETPDLLALKRRHDGPNFELVPILTGSTRKLDLEGARAVLAKVGAEALPTLVEPDGGERVMEALASRPGIGANLPCMLILDAQGRVRGRSFGGVPLKDVVVERKDGALTERGKAQLLASRSATDWSTPAAEAFVAGLAHGALDKPGVQPAP